MRLSDQTVEKPLEKINGVWGEAPSKVAGAAAPDNKPLPEGKGLGLGIENLFYLLKKSTFSTS